MTHRIRHVWLPLAASIFAVGFGIPSAHAVNAVPGPAELQRLNDILNPRGTPIVQPALIPAPAADPSITQDIRKHREDTRFLLTGLEVRGVTLYEPADLAPLIGTITGQETSLAELDDTAARITRFYRDNGHFLARAILPAQEIIDGKVVIQVIEGQLGDVIVNKPDIFSKSSIINAIINRLKNGPLTSDRLETALLSLNDLPGVNATGTLVAGKKVGTTDVVINLSSTRLHTEAELNNYGTRYIGPNQAMATIQLNNMAHNLGVHDSLRLRFLQTPRLPNFTYADGQWRSVVNSHGTTVEVNAHASVARPEWTLQALDIESHANGFGFKVEQPLVRLRPLTWKAYGTFDYSDADSKSMGNRLTTDHLRVARVGTTLDSADRLRGFNNANLEVSRGLGILGASENDKLGASRSRGYASDFTKLNLDLSRLQQLNDTVNILVSAQGQFSTHALMAGEEFAFGGTNMGRGLENNELIGDHGAAARAELQYNFGSQLSWLNAWQLFGFYDFGAVWNKDRDPTERNDAETALTGGFGVRLDLAYGLAADFTYAKPFTHKIATKGNENSTFYFRLQHKFDGLVTQAEPAAGEATP